MGKPTRTRHCESRIRSLQLSGLLFLALALLTFAVPPGAGAAPLELQYRLTLLRPTTHLLEVEITASGATAPALDFALPAWAPGRYAIYDFAKNVQEFEATDGQNHKLSWSKLDKQTWHVETQEPGGTVKVRYHVFANDLTGSFSQFDSSHANLNGASLFMYIENHKPDPLTLTVTAPAGWKLISGFSLSIEKRIFQVPNYDRLIDTPLEISPQCSVEQFIERGKTIRVAVHSFADADGNTAQLVDGLKKVVRSELAMMPDPDLQHYTFLFHFAPGLPLGDGMEHFNSTEVIGSGELSGSGLAEALENAAHEFFHLWNVKRLRPAGLGPFDYTREQYTRSLWFAEGVTSYYSYLHLYRAGIWTREKFLQRLADEIRNLENEPGRALMSAESSSFHAWFYDRSPQMQETNFANTTISYYNKGAVLGLLLDLEIRARTEGRKSLDDVLTAMYRKFYEAPVEGYYAPGRGYQEKDILETVNEVTGSDFTEFFAEYVSGTSPLPYRSTLAQAGLELRVRTTPDSPPSLGVLTQRVPHGLKIAAVRPGRAADRGGLSRDDVLIAVDELSLTVADLEDRLRIYPPGAEVPFTVERHGKLERISVVLDPPYADQYSLEPLPQPGTRQLNIRNGWLGNGK
ncbi:MAG: PDZ domain-containing protein [Acidobacteriia bacterium]|nr:PDZ domain-containing protein [Terriglobia bacterium]